MTMRINNNSELYRRIIANYDRLEGIEYRPEGIFDMDKNGWPADWEGRTILALVLHWTVTGREPVYLCGILKRLQEELNAKGYVKQICADGTADEQQLSGHNWLLRGLMEHYRLTGCEESMQTARRIVENLYLPAMPLYEVYPVSKEERGRSGAAAGTLAGFMNGWMLSTDIGCAFMSFDALSQYFELTGDARVKALIERMYDAFSKIDFVGASMQTHASLSACRGLMRFSSVTGREDIFEFVKRFFDLYTRYGMTANYANYNWFARPEWTEPCAVVDSFMLSLMLFKRTKEYAYLQYAHRIWKNAILHAQRPNGGFGCDTCVREEAPFLKVKIYEANWCCSMRGAEGLFTAVKHTVWSEGENAYVTGFGGNDVVLPEYIGKLRVHMYLPESVKPETIKILVNGQKTDFAVSGGFAVFTADGASRVQFSFECETVTTDVVMNGDCLLTAEALPLEYGFYMDKERLLARDVRLVLNKKRG